MPSSALSNFRLAALTLGVLACAAFPLRAQDNAPLAQNSSLQQLMTPEEFKAAGLKKLSSGELTRLENFLRGYREQAVQQVAKATEERVKERENPAPKRDQATHQSVVESSISGPFTGLKGRTRVVLKNGSIWQQGNDNDKFNCNLDSPDVVLVRTVFGYKMYVTGAPRWFYVKQVVM